MLALQKIVPRVAEGFIEQLVGDEPAVLIEGPRGSGKSTLLRSITAKFGGRIVDLDDAGTLAAIRAGSQAPLASPGLVAIDEFQRAPEVLLTVKRVVDREGGPGRFLIAGSVSDRLLPKGTETLTGRVQRTTLLPLSAGEVLGELHQWLPQALNGNGRVPLVHTDLRRDAVFELVSAGGFPGALRRPTLALQHRWLSSYLSTVADRDLPSLVDIRNSGTIGRLFRLVAERTATITNMAELSQRLAITPHTVRLYLGFLERCFLLHELPSWSVGLSAREGRRPKLHVIDTGLAAAAIGADARKLGRMSAGGQFVESFVVLELMKQAASIDERLTFGHYRDRTGIEADLVIERADGSIIAIEVKSSSAPDRRDARGLTFLRDHLGERFICGVVFHTGPLTIQLDDRIWATPIPALWGGSGTVT
jgi:uncharacterized protein